MSITYIDHIDLKGKRVFIRVDFNVPLSDDKKVSDDTRIKAALPTINYAIEKEAKIILASHLGRPKGKIVNDMSLKPVADHLSSLLNKKVNFVPDTIGEMVQNEISSLKEKDVILLENLRFYPGEEKNDPEFSKQLASLCDIYINDAFGAVHRAHASTVGMVRYVKEKGAGFLIKKELKYLGEALSNPKRPFVAMLGGAKVSDKIGVIENLLTKVDKLLIGGGMAYTFLKAQGVEIGNSLLETDKVGLAKNLLKEANQNGIEVLLPEDHLIAKKVDAKAETKAISNKEIPSGWMGVDIGEKTIEKFSFIIKEAKTVFWNGPMGIFEIEAFSRGTMMIAKALAESNAISIVGGGDSVAAINKAKVAQKITHISTGGGASLEFLEGKKLPGIAILEE
ncbi:MAG: phosphoglycerate kinase [Deltaproteobacteria bacterium]|nr:phosphoglycerate kinase [Deltaproteobacteria bacterium]